MVTKIDASARLGGAATTADIGTNKMICRALGKVFTYSHGYEIIPIVANDWSNQVAALNPVNLDLAVLVFTDEAKNQPMFNKTFDVPNGAQRIPREMSEEASEYTVFFEKGDERTN